MTPTIVSANPPCSECVSSPLTTLKPHAAATSAPAIADPHDFATICLHRLNDNPRDLQAAFELFRTYLLLGLHGPARELLADTSGPMNGLAETAELSAQLARKPTGRLAWGGLASRLEKNLAGLLARHAPLTRFATAFSEIAKTCDLFRTVDGSLQLSVRPETGLRHWLPRLGDDRAAAQLAQLPHEKTPGACGNYLILGDRFYHLLRRIRAATSDILVGFAPRIFLIEPDPRIFAAGLCVCDEIDCLLDPRVSLFIGADCIEQFEAFLRSSPSVSLPYYIISRPADGDVAATKVGDCLDRLTRHRQARAIDAIERAEAIYSDRTPADFARILREADRTPLRVLGITSRFTTVLQYAMRDVERAFQKLGHDFVTLREPGPHDLMTPEWMAEAVSRHRPDLIFVIDHHRAEYGRALPKNVPYVCWLQDMLPTLTDRRVGRGLGPLDFFIAPSVVELSQAYDYPPRQGLVWTLATDPELYSDEPLPEEILAPFFCDFSYVSNQSSTPRAFHERMKNAHGAGPQITALLESIFVNLTTRSTSSDDHDTTPSAALWLDAAMRQAGIGALPEPIREWIIRGYMHPLAELVFRHETLKWVADYCDAHARSFRLYGRGWENHPRFAKYASGIAENGRTLRAVYQATRFNLQINGYSAVHSRLLDGLAAGGFFLIQRTAFDTAGPLIDRVLAGNPSRVSSSDIGRCRRALGLPGGDTILANAERSLLEELATSGRRRMAREVVPHYPEITFASRQELEQRIKELDTDEVKRNIITSEARAAIVESFSYSKLARALVTHMASAIELQK